MCFNQKDTWETTCYSYVSGAQLLLYAPVIDNHICLGSRKPASSRLLFRHHFRSSTRRKFYGSLTAVSPSRPTEARGQEVSPRATRALRWAAATRQWRTTRTRWTKAWVAPPVRSTLTTRTARQTARRCPRPTACSPTSGLTARCGPRSCPSRLWSAHTPPPSTRPR